MAAPSTRHLEPLLPAAAAAPAGKVKRPYQQSPPQAVIRATVR